MEQRRLGLVVHQIDQAQIAVVVEHHILRMDHWRELQAGEHHLELEELPSWGHSVEESVEHPSLALRMPVEADPSEADPSEVPSLRTFGAVPSFVVVPFPFEAVPFLVDPLAADHIRS